MTTIRRLRVGLGRGLRRFERSIGAEREGRSPWVWAVPLVTVVGTIVLTIKVAGDGGLSLAAALPLALLLSLFMGGMSVAYLAAAAADMRDAQAPDDGGGNGGGPHRPSPPTPPRRPAVRRWVEIVSVHRERDGNGPSHDGEQDKVLEAAGRSRRDRD
jgi:hypothetical protein